eukprot:CAMPEP_0198652222 /NCGR_PEP_ID=MMETSP1467-20131203/6229_1 /TAXON_ID=1462469 /ORGANISM="unid. sp., Strain CCMP2135" /LENGTH=232 /DNA_ID=CAMNT_0044388131 /DNA_START=3 /DNA_END=701 /DNA_ORIENTATION=-
MDGNGVVLLSAEEEEEEVLSQGAEARVYGVRLFGMRAVAKHRFAKSYRSPALDTRLRKERLATEVRCLARLRQVGVATPAVLMVDSARHVLYLERVAGVTAKAYIDRYRATDLSPLMAKIGDTVARIHDAGLTHGDLTTSNFLCRNASLDGSRAVDELVVIDFGLGGMRAQPEDKAVDLYVLERALVSTHREARPLLDAALAEYARVSTLAQPVLHRLDAVRARGRKRDCFG